MKYLFLFANWKIIKGEQKQLVYSDFSFETFFKYSAYKPSFNSCVDGFNKPTNPNIHFTATKSKSHGEVSP
jgi:hypothetical protein